MTNRFNNNENEELLKSKGNIYSGIIILIVIVAIILILGFLTILYLNFRNA